MTHRGIRSPLKAAVTALTIGCFLVFAQGSVTCVFAADAGGPAPQLAQTWESWPRKSVEPGVEKPPPPTAVPPAAAPSVAAPPSAAAAAGEAAGKKTATGISAGTIGWIALGIGAAFAVGVAAAGGGGGDGTTSSVTCP